MIYTLRVFYYHGFQCLINSYFDGTICSLSQYSWRYSINKISILANHACIFPLQIPTSMSLFCLIWVCQTIKETFKDYVWMQWSMLWPACFTIIHEYTYHTQNTYKFIKIYPEYRAASPSSRNILNMAWVIPLYRSSDRRASILWPCIWSRVFVVSMGKVPVF